MVVTDKCSERKYGNIKLDAHSWAIKSWWKLSDASRCVRKYFKPKRCASLEQPMCLNRGAYLFFTQSPTCGGFPFAPVYLFCFRKVEV